MRSVLEEEKEEEEVKLSELVFADDVALVTNNTKEAQIILAAEVGLFVNSSRTEIMITTDLKTFNEEQETTERIIKVEFNTKRTETSKFPQTIVYLCYCAPANAENHRNKSEAFYRELSASIDTVNGHAFLVSGGNFNARLGKDRHRSAIEITANENGDILQDFIDEKRLFPVLTQKDQRFSRLWTPNAVHMGEHRKTQLDHIMVRCKWIQSVVSYRAKWSYVFSSDHRPVIAACTLSLRQAKNKQTNKQEAQLDRTSNANNLELIDNKFSNRFVEVSSWRGSYADFDSNVNRAAQETYFA
jgi:hypothetical protein